MSVKIGIDLGTTNSAVAFLFDDGPAVLPRDAGVLIPSVVHYPHKRNPTEPLVGEAAANEYQRVIRSVKRFMGRTYNEALEQEKQAGRLRRGVSSVSSLSPGVHMIRADESALALRVSGDEGTPMDLWPYEVSGAILKAVKSHAESCLKTKVDQAVITVPAYFQDAHRDATLKAAREAGIDVLQPLLDEPTAAALAVARRVALSPGEPLLVVDWGGGTFDVSLLNFDGANWDQLGIAGDLNLGGDDLDLTLAELALKRQGLDPELLQDPMISSTLIKAVRSAKHVLSTKSEAALFCVLASTDSGAKAIRQTITRHDFDQAIEPHVARGMETVAACIAKAHYEPAHIPQVLLVGGSSRVGLLQQRIRDLFPKAQIYDDDHVNVMEAVALGAAISASADRPAIARICPYGYGFVRDSEIFPIIKPGAEVPTPRGLPFHMTPPARTSYENQTIYKVPLVRYEDKKGLRPIGQEVLLFGEDFPPSPKGSEVRLDLFLDDNKILHAVVFPPGGGKPTELNASGGMYGAEAVFTNLNNSRIEGLAIQEANTGVSSPLLSDLKGYTDSARTALDGGNQDRCRELVESIGDVIERLSYQRAPKTEGSENERLLGWIWYYERTILPRFHGLIGPEKLESSIEHINRFKVMSRTGCTDSELAEELYLLERELSEIEASAVLRAHRWAWTRGVPQKLQEELKALVNTAADQHMSGDRAGYHRNQEQLIAKTEEARHQFENLPEEGQIMVVDPTLKMGHKKDE